MFYTESSLDTVDYLYRLQTCRIYLLIDKML